MVSGWFLLLLDEFSVVNKTPARCAISSKRIGAKAGADWAAAVRHSRKIATKTCARRIGIASLEHYTNHGDRESRRKTRKVLVVLRVSVPPWWILASATQVVAPAL